MDCFCCVVENAYFCSMKRMVMMVVAMLTVGLALADGWQVAGDADLRHGDLLFCVVAPKQGSELAEAIVDVTEGKDEMSISHVAMVCRLGESVYALEATGGKGVCLTPIDSFFVQADRSAEGKPLVVQGRLKDVECVEAAVVRALGYMGRPYDDLYLPTDSAIYCSELVQLSYIDKDGRAVFPQEPMSFHDRSGKITPFWIEHYRRRQMEVPEGAPGTNPGGISRSDRIDIVRRFW